MAVKTEEDYAEGKISYQEAVDCVKKRIFEYSE
jgi:hypothetical protein